MERPERYDPEDIERLLQERGFDELLAEERAFLLRHLSGPEEYEAMRRLLQQVREGERGRPEIQAGPELRAELMARYRAERHRPSWRIWLNGVAAAFLPRPGALPWRPALALGTLALLIAAGWWMVHQQGAAPGPLAEAKPEHAKTAEAPAEEPAAQATAPSAPMQAANLATTTDEGNGALPEREAARMPEPALAEPHSEAVAMEVQNDADSATGFTRNAPAAAGQAQAGRQALRGDAAPLPRKATAPLADSPELLGLIAAGW